MHRAADLERTDPAMTTVKRKSKQLGRVLIDLGMIKEADLVRALAEQVGLEFVDLTDIQIDPASTALLPEALARRYRALPIGERDGKLLVAMSDPANVYALDDIRTITGRDVRGRRAGDLEVRRAGFARRADRGRGGRGLRTGGARPRGRPRGRADRQ